MPEIESFQISAKHYLELARSNNFLQEDIALVAFELLTANDYDRMLAYAPGVSL